MVSHEHKFIFVHVPKCAGTSIETYFGHNAEHLNQDHRTIRELEPLALSPLATVDGLQILAKRARNRVQRLTGGGHATLNTDQYNSYYKFAFVRNPWDRTVSWYKNMMRNKSMRQAAGLAENCDLATFVESQSGKGGLRPQTYWLNNARGELAVDFVGRFEQLEADFTKVCDHLEMPREDLPKMLVKGGRADYRALYTPQLEKQVGKLFKEEISLFGYSF